jgi:GxxExxY protein
MLNEDLTERIIGCAYAVSNGLGAGFLESVYEKALIHELRKAGLKAEQQVPLQVKYDGVVVGEFYTDILVNNEVVIELKAVRTFEDIHMAQCLNYLRATGLKVALLINFGTPKLQIKRVVL